MLTLTSVVLENAGFVIERTTGGLSCWLENFRIVWAFKVEGLITLRRAWRFRSIAACSLGDFVLADFSGSRGVKVAGDVFSRGIPMLRLLSSCLVSSVISSEVRLLLCRAAKSFCSSGTICGIFILSPPASIADFCPVVPEFQNEFLKTCTCSMSVGEMARGGSFKVLF